MEKYGKDGRNARKTNYLQERSVLHKRSWRKIAGNLADNAHIPTGRGCCRLLESSVAAVLSVHPQARFRYQNLDLLKVLQECPFQPCNKSAAALLSKIKGGHDNDFIDVKPSLA